ncbi:ABC-2 type transport system permease protein [Mariniphaga anaerophila]|uniref:ABC-2 type transport system permease protein n=1 Tax=Mariniphaga anaerophila TaxID=1484053 RepID=A0A1M5FET2_9BACT|nr:ABC transporter permease [Mariniphaga anaerophila]SHF90060.1 ABC-2 type transport system permease protein [Mariniphaga anaerophila]
MKTILYILQKEFRQIFRNRTMLPMIFGVPLVQMLILVFAATFDMKKIDMVVVDKDLSTTSRQLVAKFDGIPFYHVSQAVMDEKQAEALLLNGESDIALVIPANFERNLIRNNNGQLQLLIDAVDGNSAQLIYAYSGQIISSFNKNLIAHWKGIPEFAPPTQVKISETYWYNNELDYKWYMAPGILAILVTIIGMFMSGMNLVREKEIGTIEQLNVTPVKKYQFIIGKLVPFWVIALFDLAFGLLIAWLVFDLPIVGSLWLLFGFAGVYLIGVLGLGLFISTVTDTQQQVMFVSFFFMMIFILMGGIFTPVESMPHWAQIADRINPIFYFMKILRMIILKGSGFSDLLSEFLALCVLGVVFLSLAIWRYRKTI